MAYEGSMLTHTMVASVDLSDQTLGNSTGAIYKAIALDDGDFAQNGLEAIGILRYGGQSRNHISVGVSGIMKFTCHSGGALVAGERLTVTLSGYLIGATSGTWVVGRNLENAVSANAVGTGFFNFSAPIFQVNCFGTV